MRFVTKNTPRIYTVSNSTESTRRSKLSRKVLARASFVLGRAPSTLAIRTLSRTLRRTVGVETFSFNCITNKIFIDYDPKETSFYSLQAIVTRSRGDSNYDLGLFRLPTGHGAISQSLDVDSGGIAP